MRSLKVLAAAAVLAALPLAALAATQPVNVPVTANVAEYAVVGPINGFTFNYSGLGTANATATAEFSVNTNHGSAPTIVSATGHDFTLRLDGTSTTSTIAYEISIPFATTSTASPYVFDATAKIAKGYTGLPGVYSDTIQYTVGW
jgi:spore coat protein U-like protein